MSMMERFLRGLLKSFQKEATYTLIVGRRDGSVIEKPYGKDRDTAFEAFVKEGTKKSTLYVKFKS